MRKTERDLKAENRRLQKENEYLRHRLVALGDGDLRGEMHRAGAEKGRALAAARSKSYFGYLLLLLKMSRTFRVLDRTAFAFRRVFFASKLWRILRLFAFAVGAGTGAIAFLGAALIALPAVLLFTLFAAGGEMLSRRKRNRFFEKKLRGVACYIVFAPAGKKRGGYFDFFLRTLAENGTVLVVSRSYFDCGFSGAAAISPSIYRIHISYYFSLMHRLEGISPRVVRIV